MPALTLLPEELEADRLLQSLGLRVRRVPTSTSKTPEFIVDGDARGYVLEVKARDDSEEWTRAMKSGRAAHQKRSLGCGRWAEDVAGNAVKQLRSADAQHLRWWVLWLAIKCAAGADAMVDEAIGSLFGVRQVVFHGPGSEDQPKGRNCLFARPGVFERHPDIVASVVDSGRGLCFCVNDEFAGDFSSFRESVLWSSFADMHPPTTAKDLTESRGFFRADPSVNRRDDSALAAYLERAYRLKKAVMVDMQLHSTSMYARSDGMVD